MQKQPKFAYSTLRLMGAMTVVLLAILLLGCGDEDGDYDRASNDYDIDDDVVLALTFSPDPPRVGDVELSMELIVDGEPIEGAGFDIEPWMPSHGHGSSTEPEVFDVGDGTYTVDELTFSMAGHWELRIDMDYGDRNRELVVDLEVEG